GKLILQGLEIMWLQWKSAYQTGEVIDAVLAQSHNAFADHAAALGGLARLIRSARQNGAMAIGRWSYGHSVRVRVVHCHNKNPQALLRALVQLGGNIYPVLSAEARGKPTHSPAPNWRGICGT